MPRIEFNASASCWQANLEFWSLVPSIVVVLHVWCTSSSCTLQWKYPSRQIESRINSLFVYHFLSPSPKNTDLLKDTTTTIVRQGWPVSKRVFHGWAPRDRNVYLVLILKRRETICTYWHEKSKWSHKLQKSHPICIQRNSVIRLAWNVILKQMKNHIQILTRCSTCAKRTKCQELTVCNACMHDLS